MSSECHICLLGLLNHLRSGHHPRHGFDRRSRLLLALQTSKP